MTTILCGMRRNRRIDDPRSPRISLSTAILTVCACTLGPPAMASPQAVAQPASEALDVEIDRLALEAQGDLVTWRRDIHRHPELGNREFRTSSLVAEHLRGLGLETRTGIAHTGVIGVLRGGIPGPVVGLRADMDALPVEEDVDLSFASRVRTEYAGREVGVMHACGHDAHTAILMGAAQVLAGVRERLPGTVVFVFQPAEEGAPEGEEGGAELMLAVGGLDDPAPEAYFGLHASPGLEVGQIGLRAGGAMASSDSLRIVVRGRQTHAAYPWGGLDPIVVSSQIVLGLQSIVSRQIDLTQAPAVISIGMIHGGVRGNIIPDEVELVGTVRTLHPGMREDVHERIRTTARGIADAAGAAAEVTITRGYPVTYNDPDLVRRMVGTLHRIAGEDHVAAELPPTLASEDFSFFQQRAPGVYFWLGIRTPGASLTEFPANHSPRFRVDEDALIVGVRALAHLAADYLSPTR